VDKKALSERDICTKFITPAVAAAGWDIQRQVREEVTFTKGRVIVRGKLHTRGRARRADYVLYHQANLPLAVIEAKPVDTSVAQRGAALHLPDSKSERDTLIAATAWVHCVGPLHDLGHPPYR
jgi:type I site-specific restriction endonuclease